MARRSAAAAAIATPVQVIPRLQPPAGLTATADAVWRSVVAAMPAGWFRREHFALLERYARHVARAGELETLIEATDPVADLDRYAALVRLAGVETARVAQLARAMRLTHQSQLKSELAANRTARTWAASTPEEDRAAARELAHQTRKERNA